MSKLFFNAGSKMCFCMAAAVLSAPLLFSACSNPQSGGTFTDSRDGQTYRTVRIGNLTWMAQNLNFKTGNSWCYDDDLSNCAKYGRLYDWETALTACPSGWRLPDNKDWNDLTKNAGGYWETALTACLSGWRLPDNKDWNDSTKSAGGYVAGRKLKASSPDWNGTDKFGFSALPGGYRNTNGSFYDAGSYGSWWSATEFESGKAWYRDMASNYDFVREDNSGEEGSGFSALCVR